MLGANKRFYEDFRIPRRNWNLAFQFIGGSLCLKILEYLGGIETKNYRIAWEISIKILEYLGGIETCTWETDYNEHYEILEYLGGIETEYTKG